MNTTNTFSILILGILFVWILNKINLYLKQKEYEQFTLPPASNPTVAMYMTNWCGYSIKRLPVFKALQKELAKQSNSIKIDSKIHDCEKYPDECRRVGVKSYPTFALLTPKKTIILGSQVPSYKQIVGELGK